jgi:CRP/FNR family cyclic AMP-dependent transcriptional regulator
VGLPLLERLTSEEQQLLLQHSNLIFKPRGSYIFIEGDPATHFFLLKEGTVRIHKLLHDGKEITIFIREKNDGFGEIGPFSGETYSCSSRAETDCEIYAIKPAILDQVLTENGRISSVILKWIAEKLETSSSKIKDFLMFGTEGAVASFLIRIANSRGVRVPDGTLIKDQVTHYQIATHIGSSRETVTRILNDLRKREIIEFQRNTLLIKDIVYLRNLLNCDKCGVHNCIF